MTKYEWERELKQNLSALPSDEVARVLDYYDELFEDKAESGKSEAYIIKEFGNPFDVARRIMNEFEAENGALAGSKMVDEREYSGGYTQEEIDTMPFITAVKINLKKSLNKVKSKLVGVSKPPSAKPLQDEDINPVAPVAPIDPWQHDEGDEGYSIRRHGSKTFEREARRNELSDYKAQIERERKELERERKELENSKNKVIKKTKGGCARTLAKLIFFIPFIIVAITGWSVAISLLASGVACVLGGIAMPIMTLFGFASGTLLINLGSGMACAGIGLALTVVSLKLVKIFGILSLRYFGYKGKKAASVEQQD